MSERPVTWSRASAVGLVVAALLLTALLYRPALDGPPLLDDSVVVEPLMRATDLAHHWRAWWLGEGGDFLRPVANLTFIANAIVNDGNLRWWKATNLAIHLATGWLLFLLLSELFAAARATDEVARGRIAAAFAASLWLVHPLHVSTVMYTVQRMAELAAMFSLLGMLCYARGRRAGAGTARGRIGVACAYLVCTPLAAFSKQTGVLLPLFLALMEFTVYAGARWPRPRWLVVLHVAMLALPCAAAAVWFGSEPGRLLGAYTLRDFGPVGRMLTEPRIVVGYLRWIVAPSLSALGFFHDDVRASRSWLDPPDTLPCIALVVALLAVAVLGRRRYPLVALGLGLFFAGQALESTVFGLELAFEHRNYLPSAGIMLAAAALAERLRDRRLTVVVGVAVLTLFAFVTAQRTALWGDEFALYRFFVHAHPRSERARVTLAEWYTARRDYDDALALFARVDTPTAGLYRLRVRCARNGIPGDGSRSALKALSGARLASFDVLTLLLLARQSLDDQCALDGAQLARALEDAAAGPLRAVYRYRLLVYAAMLHRHRGEKELAFSRLRQASRFLPGDPFPWYLAAEWAADEGRAVEARRFLAEARRRRHGGVADYGPMDRAVGALIEGQR